MIVFVIFFGFSASAFIQDKSDTIKYDLNKDLIGCVFIFSSIYNLSYFEEEEDPDIILKGYSFNCKNVMMIYWSKEVGFFMEISNEGEWYAIMEFSMWYMDYYYKGYVGEKFICALEIVVY